MITRPVRIGVAIVAVIAGAALVYTAPQTDDLSRPIEVRGAIGQAIDGRGFSATVSEVRFATRLRLTDGARVSTPGVWLVVSARVVPHLRSVLLGNSTLRVNGVTYAAYEDPADRDLSAPTADAGIPVVGTLAFEVPSSVRRASSAELVLNRGTLVPDDVLVVPLRPNRLSVVPEAEIEPQTRVGRGATG